MYPQHNNNDNHTQNTNKIRHAGRASVRGKIRRVWRPRYLELLDNGHVKYYEEQEAPVAVVAATAARTTTNNPTHSAWEEDLSVGTTNCSSYSQASAASSQHHRGRRRRRHYYKYRLQILHARILDGTTLRDLHVGLPRGAYGWVFRARRLVPLGSVDAVDGGGDQEVVVSTHQVVHDTNTHMPSTLPPQQQQQQQQQHILWTPDPLKEERDFFCAVTQLEVAQMWVVALQWAAAMRTDPSQHAVVSSHPLGDEDWEHASYTSPETLDYITRVPKTSTNDDAVSLVSSQPSVVSVPSTPPAPTSTGRTPPSRPQKSGTTVVTKVTGWHMVRTGALEWTLAYQIEVFMVKRHVTTGTQVPQYWTVYRTASDVQRLVHTLQTSATVPLFPVTMPDYHKSTDYPHLWTWLDWFLRKLVTDATWLNTTAVKQFLGLQPSCLSRLSLSDGSNAGAIQGAWYTHLKRLVQPLISIHDGQEVYTTIAATSLDSSALSAASTERLAKEWLAHRPIPHAPEGWTRAMWWLSRQAQSTTLPPSPSSYWAVAAAPGGALCYWWTVSTATSETDSSYASVASAPPSFMPRITLRLDVLVVSWVGAAYLGQWVWPRVTTSSTKPTVDTRRVVSRRKENVSTVDINVDASVGDDTTDDLDDDSFGDAPEESMLDGEEPLDGATATLSSPLPRYPENNGQSCWSQPPSDIFYVRSQTYLQDRVKKPSDPAPLQCRGVDVWMTDNPERHIARHPAVLGGKLPEEDTFLVNFLLPFGNFVAYFGIPPLTEFPEKLRNVWTKFLQGDQQYRDARLKLLPVVVEGPWIVKAAVGPGKSPALLGKVIPLQYFFEPATTEGRKAVYEVDVIITASTIAKGILSVVKGHTKSVSIAFAFIIEASEEADLPETVLCTFQVHSLHLEECPILPPLPESDGISSRLQ